MDRRGFISSGAAALGAASFATGALGQAAPARKLKIDAYSRHLQWLRDPSQVAEAVLEMGFDGLDVTVRPYPGHVDPAKVRTELPRFVETIRRNGLQVVQIACPINDADTPHAEAILDTAASLGIRHYWGGNWQYDQSRPPMAQLDALKPRVERLVALNRKYDANFMSHTRTGPATVGNAIWDALYLMRDFDPRHVSLHWDSGHSSLAGANNTWALNLRAAGPYVGGISIKDELLEGPITGAASEGDRPPGAAPGPPGGGAGGAGQGGGASNPWRVKYVPLGQGYVNLPLLARVLREIDFAGPVEIQAEYPLGGAENARDQITLPRAEVLGAMRRDRLTLRAAFEPAGLL
jgi:sugar phosphate isomerase/epimerase